MLNERENLEKNGILGGNRRCRGNRAGVPGNLEHVNRSEWETETVGSRKVWRDVILEKLGAAGDFEW